MGVLANVTIMLDDAGGVDDGVIANAGAGVDDGVGADVDAFAEDGGGVDGGSRMHERDGVVGQGIAKTRKEYAAGGEVSERKDARDAGAGCEVAQRAKARQASFEAERRLIAVVNEAGDMHAGSQGGREDDLCVAATADEDERQRCRSG
jgi:hypothetical protein